MGLSKVLQMTARAHRHRRVPLQTLLPFHRIGRASLQLDGLLDSSSDRPVM